MDKDARPPHPSSPGGRVALPDRDRLLELVADLVVVHGRGTLFPGPEADWYIDMVRLRRHPPAPTSRSWRR